MIFGGHFTFFQARLLPPAPIFFFSKQGYFLPPPFHFFPSKATSSRPHFSKNSLFWGYFTIFRRKGCPQLAISLQKQQIQPLRGFISLFLQLNSKPEMDHRASGARGPRALCTTGAYPLRVGYAYPQGL